MLSGVSGARWGSDDEEEHTAQPMGNSSVFPMFVCLVSVGVCFCDRIRLQRSESSPKSH